MSLEDVLKCSARVVNRAKITMTEETENKLYNASDEFKQAYKRWFNAIGLLTSKVLGTQTDANTSSSDAKPAAAANSSAGKFGLSADALSPQELHSLASVISNHTDQLATFFAEQTKGYVELKAKVEGQLEHLKDNIKTKELTLKPLEDAAYQGKNFICNETWIDEGYSDIFAYACALTIDDVRKSKRHAIKLLSSIMFRIHLLGFANIALRKVKQFSQNLEERLSEGMFSAEKEDDEKVKKEIKKLVKNSLKSALIDKHILNLVYEWISSFERKLGLPHEGDDVVKHLLELRSVKV